MQTERLRKRKKDDPLQESTARSLGEAVLQYYKTILSYQNFIYIHAYKDFFCDYVYNKIDLYMIKCLLSSIHMINIFISNHWCLHFL